MIKLNIRKAVTFSLVTACLFSLTPMKTNAAWKKDTTGWWYTVNNSYSRGWKEIDGKWYYFYSNGYMAHDTIIGGYKLGSDGAWITNTLNNSNKSTESKITEVTVGNAQEFVNSIGSNKKIILKPGVYNLSDVKQINNSDSGVKYIPVDDGDELNIIGIHDLTIEGAEAGKVEIKVAPRFANIMNFSNAKNITIKNIVAGHTPAKYECNAGVLKFTNSNNISIANSHLYGCGSIGLDLHNVSKLEASNCLIYHCSLRAIQIYDSSDIKFVENKIIDHEAYSNIVMIDGGKGITFEKCEFANNNNFMWSFIETSNKSDILFDSCVIKNNSKSSSSEFNDENICLFKTTDYFGKCDSKITVRNSEITKNTCDSLVDNKESVKFDDCTINNNTFSK